MRLSRNRKGYPPSFYDKATELLNQVPNISDPDAKQVALIAVRRYFEADVKPREPFIATLFSLIAPYAVIFFTAMWAFRSLGFVSACAVLIASYSVLAFLVGAALLAAGYISETTFVGITKEGFKTLLLMRKRQ